MRVAVLSVLTIAAAAACARGNTTRYTQWPYEGPMMMVRNPTPNPVVVLARDGMGRELITARLQPNSNHSCNRVSGRGGPGYVDD